MQVYTIYGTFPLTFVQKGFVPVEVVDRQVFWGGVGLHSSCLIALVGGDRNAL